MPGRSVPAQKRHVVVPTDLSCLIFLFSLGAQACALGIGRRCSARVAALGAAQDTENSRGPEQGTLFVGEGLCVP